MSSSERDVPTIARDLLDALHDVLPFDRGTVALREQIVATRGDATEEARSTIVVPLTIGCEIIGNVTLECLDADRFTPHDAAIARAFARTAATAMEFAQRHEEERRARQRAELLAAATEAISTTLDVREIYTLVLQQLRRVVPYDCASIQELQDDELVVLGGVGFAHDNAVGFRFSVRSADAPNGDVVRQRKPMILDDAARDFPSFRQGPPAEEGIHSWIGVPLVFGDRVIGMLTLDRRERGFYRAEHAEVAVVYARRAAIAMEHARLYSTAKRELMQREIAEAALRESEQRFRQVTEAIQEAFWLIDAATSRTIYVSPAYETIWGRTRESLYEAASSWFDALVEEDRDLVRQAAMTVPSAGGYDIQYRIARPDGTTRWIRDRGFPVRNEAGEIYRIAGVAEDITASKQLEMQYLHAQKMEAVGLLAGGVAHDFNNLLAVILACADVLRARTDENDPRMRGIEEIAKAVDRASTLVRQLLAFGRKQVLSPRVLALGTLVQEMQTMFRRLLPEHIDLRVSVAEDLGRINADVGQFEQAILNIVLNARDAMPDGGKLEIDLANSELDAEYARLRPSVKPGRYVMLTVRDNGTGMDAATQARIFEPFFTTKEPGKGSGLGLAMVYGVVEQSGGHIWVYSEAGLGTTFKIYLPRVDQPEESSSVATSHASDARGDETVLLVEDDEALRTATHELLESRGYRVLSAQNGSEALEIANAFEGEIDLLLTDVVMPGMNGSQLASRLRTQRPAMKVLYASGYIDATLHGDVLGRGATLIHKPFTAIALAEKMREVLDSLGG